VAALKARGFQSPYLRQFVAARINPIRFAKTVEMTPEELLDNMMEKAEKFDVGAVKEDQGQSAGGFGGGADGGLRHPRLVPREGPPRRGSRAACRGGPRRDSPVRSRPVLL